MKYKVVEIFGSIDGEGIRTGMTVSFIRLAGCNLRCSYCDTLYALFGEKEKCEYTEMTTEEILEKVNPSFKRVTLTGGEPLISQGIGELVQKLSDNGYEINIETNGATDINKFMLKLKSRENVFFTVDYKLPTSGVSEKMIWTNFISLEKRDVVKLVIGSEEDVECMLQFIDKLKKECKTMPQIFIGVVYGKYEMKNLVNLMLSKPLLAEARFQIQVHKIVWNPDERGV